VYDLGYRVVWCPKYRRAVLGGPVAVWYGELIRAKSGGRGWRIVALEIMADQGHLLVQAHPCNSASRIASQVRRFTSRLRAGSPYLRSRLPASWSRSYFGARADAVSAETVCRYIDTQNERPWRKVGAR
jgi:putative transposase